MGILSVLAFFCVVRRGQQTVGRRIALQQIAVMLIVQYE
jgi:hypothetical protein